MLPACQAADQTGAAWRALVTPPPAPSYPFHPTLPPSPQVRSHNEFSIGMRVTRALAGKTVFKSGLRQLPNAFLTSIDRHGTIIHAVAPDEVLEEGDILWFAGGDSQRGGVRTIAWFVGELVLRRWLGCGPGAVAG